MLKTNEEYIDMVQYLIDHESNYYDFTLYTTKEHLERMKEVINNNTVEITPTSFTIKENGRFVTITEMPDEMLEFTKGKDIDFFAVPMEPKPIKMKIEPPIPVIAEFQGKYYRADGDGVTTITKEEFEKYD